MTCWQGSRKSSRRSCQAETRGWRETPALREHARSPSARSCTRSARATRPGAGRGHGRCAQPRGAEAAAPERACSAF
jgi:hypothetical protein